MTYNWPGTIFTWPYSTEDPALMMRQVDEALKRLNAKVDAGGGGGGTSSDPGNMATVGSDGGVFVEDAPQDGQQYARQNGAWTVVIGGGGSFPEAPLDGFAYGRQDADWTQVLRPTDTIDGGTWS